MQMNKSKKKIILLIIIIGIFFALSGIISIIIPNNSSNNKTEETTENLEDYVVSGIYKGETCQIYLYKNDDKTLNFFIQDDSELSGELTLDKNKGLANIRDKKLDFTFQKDSLKIEISDKYFCNGSYKKTKDLTKEDFYNAKYNISELTNSKYSGVYVNTNSEIEMTLYAYQKNNLEVSVCYVRADEKYKCMIHKIDYNDENNIIFGPGNKVLVSSKYDNDKIIVTDNIKRNGIDYSGEYVKKSNITLEELMNLKYPIY